MLGGPGELFDRIAGGPTLSERYDMERRAAAYFVRIRLSSEFAMAPEALPEPVLTQRVRTIDHSQRLSGQPALAREVI